MTATRRRRRLVGLYVLVAVLAGLGLGTVSNVLRLNGVNAKFAEQARNGQLGLNRQCHLLPISEKLYIWAATDPKSHITPDEAALVVSTATAVCPHP